MFAVASVTAGGRVPRNASLKARCEGVPYGRPAAENRNFAGGREAEPIHLAISKSHKISHRLENLGIKFLINLQL